MYTYNGFTLLCSRNQHSIVKQLCMCVCVCARSLQSCLNLCHPMDCTPRLLSPWDSPGKNTGVGCKALLQCPPVPRIKPASPALADGFFTASAIWEALSVQLSRVSDSATPWTTIHQASLSITNSGVHSNSCQLSQ